MAADRANSGIIMKNDSKTGPETTLFRAGFPYLGKLEEFHKNSSKILFVPIDFMACRQYNIQAPAKGRENAMMPEIAAMRR